MNELIVAALIVAPTLIDLTVQYIVHRRTMKHIQHCPYCPHMEETLLVDDETTE